jgi:tRNA threonylcarbamoyladenosine biosynthesis protein TsaE
MKQYRCPDPESFEKPARSIADWILETEPSGWVGLQADMGVGKTTFMQYLLPELGVFQDATSPTFDLYHLYKRSLGCDLVHYDLYRLDAIDEAELQKIDWYTMVEELAFVEWPERLPGFVEDPIAWISLELDGEDRILTFRTLD